MTSPPNLNPGSPVPLYIQLKNSLLRLIRQGDIKPHERLPSERELGEEFGISRMTVRQAIQPLIRDGFLYTQAGKGTYVGEIRFEQDRTLTGFSEEMNKLGLTPSSQVLETSIVPALADMAEKLEISPNSGVIRISRLRKANGQVIALETTHLPQMLCPNLLKYDFSRESLYAVLRQDYGLKLVSAEQTVEAALANRQELHILQLKSPAAVLRMQRTTRTDQGTVAEYVESVYRGDRYKLSTTLSVNSE